MVYVIVQNFMPGTGTTIDRLRRQIQRLLKQRGATQAQLAAAVGHSAAWLSMILRGRRDIQISEIDKIAAFLEVTPARLLDDPDHEPILLRAILEEEAKTYGTPADPSGTTHPLIQRLQHQREIIARYAQTIARQQRTIAYVLSQIGPRHQSPGGTVATGARTYTRSPCC